MNPSNPSPYPQFIGECWDYSGSRFFYDDHYYYDSNYRQLTSLPGNPDDFYHANYYLPDGSPNPEFSTYPNQTQPTYYPTTTTAAGGGYYNQDPNYGYNGGYQQQQQVWQGRNRQYGQNDYKSSSSSALVSGGDGGGVKFNPNAKGFVPKGDRSKAKQMGDRGSGSRGKSGTGGGEFRDEEDDAQAEEEYFDQIEEEISDLMNRDQEDDLHEGEAVTKEYEHFLKTNPDYQHLILEIQAAVPPIPLIFRGLASKVTEEKLVMFIKSASSSPEAVKTGKVNFPVNGDGSSKGHAVIYFNDHQSAYCAAKRLGQKLEGRSLQVGAFISSKTGGKRR
eukprot:CAMPEP_0115013230 /NCGR_PEP_ID=MMETSP0216-20121206/25270_1 /TAXON_ID=223996 /ORGANISM="Protocruzia adherens, Strain Boccale" /LENGTH=333 /DNA_ID=CAMNT_0002382561 /DNA_START=134 /DNA_END=1135 /DNA_ORIENTATION=-